MKQSCYHCKEEKDCTVVGRKFLCNDHKDLKQYVIKQRSNKQVPIKRSALSPVSKKTGKPYQIKKSGKVNKVSKKESLNIRNKHKAYDILAETQPHLCTGCGTGSNLTHSHLVPTGQNKKLEAVVSNITYHCVDCHTKWEHDLEGRKTMLDYQENMYKIQVLDPAYYALVVNKQ